MSAEYIRTRIGNYGFSFSGYRYPFSIIVAMIKKAMFNEQCPNFFNVKCNYVILKNDDADSDDSSDDSSEDGVGENTKPNKTDFDRNAFKFYAYVPIGDVTKSLVGERRPNGDSSLTDYVQPGIWKEDPNGSIIVQMLDRLQYCIIKSEYAPEDIRGEGIEMYEAITKPESESRKKLFNAVVRYIVSRVFNMF